MNEHQHERPLVLIVDDLKDGRDLCAEFLSFKGYGVATAGDGVEALEQASALLPDVILMDISLPKLDGLEATRRLRADPQTRDIPVIALTAHALKSARDDALEAGCDSVVTKPCRPTRLEVAIRRQLEQGRGPIDMDVEEEP